MSLETASKIDHEAGRLEGETTGESQGMAGLAKAISPFTPTCHPSLCSPGFTHLVGWDGAVK